MGNPTHVNHSESIVNFIIEIVTAFLPKAPSIELNLPPFSYWWTEEELEKEDLSEDPDQHLYELYEEEMQMQYQEDEEERYLLSLRMKYEEEQERAAINKWLKEHPEDPWGDGREFPWANE
jgi:hypothetical protein